MGCRYGDGRIQGSGRRVLNITTITRSLQTLNECFLSSRARTVKLYIEVNAGAYHELFA